MAKKKQPQSLEALTKMAKAYGIDKNPVVQSALEQYALQQSVILEMKKGLEGDDILTTKEYVKGRENVYANPILKELPRHTDSANKTADLILKMIDQLGHEPKREGKLSALSKV